MSRALLSTSIRATCTPIALPSGEEALGSPGAKKTSRARYGFTFPFASRIALRFAMFEAIAFIRVRCAIIPLVEMSRSPYIARGNGLPAGDPFFLRASPQSRPLRNRRPQQVAVLLQQIRCHAKHPHVFRRGLHQPFQVAVISIVEENVPRRSP